MYVFLVDSGSVLLRTVMAIHRHIKTFKRPRLRAELRYTNELPKSPRLFKLSDRNVNSERLLGESSVLVSSLLESFIAFQVENLFKVLTVSKYINSLSSESVVNISDTNFIYVFFLLWPLNSCGTLCVKVKGYESWKQWDIPKMFSVYGSQLIRTLVLLFLFLLKKKRNKHFCTHVLWFVWLPKVQPRSKTPTSKRRSVTRQITKIVTRERWGWKKRYRKWISHMLTTFRKY